ncbi:hypothetical protein CC1G_02763 [Coprinopsis cinerea okayama7|uniref:Uncharacterized protein n=1 Tax=Coprinopsis cinerea (strain Okayama-7 / 130 / ATCC MYA-4618 / FGSC 9003) TaxID=240176 RepID=A8MZW2_COPC7|nr:hypothetical protein CC1G_02763 [Coprinopsis cinerea okayama7\|eukprot:XP_001828182.2 hypothetical protein CC1G_02763 [Coprinopsis cinerea okayama7\
MCMIDGPCTSTLARLALVEKALQRDAERLLYCSLFITDLDEDEDARSLPCLRTLAQNESKAVKSAKISLSFQRQRRDWKKRFFATLRAALLRTRSLVHLTLDVAVNDRRQIPVKHCDAIWSLLEYVPNSLSIISPWWLTVDVFCRSATFRLDSLHYSPPSFERPADVIMWQPSLQVVGLITDRIEDEDILPDFRGILVPDKTNRSFPPLIPYNPERNPDQPRSIPLIFGLSYVPRPRIKGRLNRTVNHDPSQSTVSELEFWGDGWPVEWRRPGATEYEEGGEATIFLFPGLFPQESGTMAKRVAEHVSRPDVVPILPHPSLSTPSLTKIYWLIPPPIQEARRFYEGMDTWFKNASSVVVYGKVDFSPEGIARLVST